MERIKGWAMERKEQLIWAAGFLALSLALFVVVVSWLLGPSQVVRRYMKAAMDYDYMAMCRQIDSQVLAWDMEQSGLDKVGMESVAAMNSVLVKHYAAAIEDDYGVKISYTYSITGTKTLDSGQRQALAQLYADGGLPLDIRKAKGVTVRSAALLMGEAGAQSLERDLELIVIQTPRGWSLDRGSIRAFWELLYDLPDFAREHFGA